MTVFEQKLKFVHEYIKLCRLHGYYISGYNPTRTRVYSMEDECFIVVQHSLMKDIGVYGEQKD
jgi:hypothetical protein